MANVNEQRKAARANARRQDRDNAALQTIEVSKELVQPIADEKTAGELATKTAINNFAATIGGTLAAELTSVETNFGQLTEKLKSVMEMQDPASLAIACGTMTPNDLNEGMRILEGIARSQEYQKKALAIKESHNALAFEEQKVRFKNIEYFLKLARQANSIGVQADSLETEQIERELKQEKNEANLLHQRELNQLSKEQQSQYRQYRKTKDGLFKAGQQATIQSLQAHLFVGQAKARKDTDWAATFAPQTVDVEAKG
jgi:hypothetical protein